MMKYFIPLPLLFLILLQGCLHDETQILIGAKIYEHKGPYQHLFQQWNDMGINTGFCSEELISDPEFMRKASLYQISTFVILPVYFNAELLAKAPHLAAIKKTGEPAKEEWVEFVCPSREDYREQVLAHARQVVRDHQPDGISIDFIRHFVYWEKVYPDRDPSTLPMSCFDPICLEHFQNKTGVSIPEELTGIPEQAGWLLNNHKEVWTEWRCQLISKMVEDIVNVAREEKPDILVNVHLVPWAEEDFDGAIRNVAGQDLQELSKLSDYLSPMTYAHMLKRPPAWIHGIVEDFYRQTGARVLPSIQVGKAYLETEFELEEFRLTMEAALEAPSSGVVIWSWERLLSEPDKVKLFKDIIRSR